MLPQIILTASVKNQNKLQTNMNPLYRCLLFCLCFVLWFFSKEKIHLIKKKQLNSLVNSILIDTCLYIYSPCPFQWATISKKNFRTLFVGGKYLGQVRTLGTSFISTFSGALYFSVYVLMQHEELRPHSARTMYSQTQPILITGSS